MIDRVGLESLPPAKRAQLIYNEAQAAMSKRLWQAALGDGRSDSDNDDGPPCRHTANRNGGDAIDALMATLGRASTRSGQTANPGDDDTIDALLATLARDATRSPATDARHRAMPAREPNTFPATIGAASGAVIDATPVPADAEIGGLGVNARYAATLAAAAERVGVPAPALAAIVDAEAGKASDGSWKIYSRNPRSSAAGLGQFLNRTWEGLAETRGTWLNDHAARQGWLGADGQVRADTRAAVLATRYDPTAAINGIADYARRNLDGLKRAGITPNEDVGATARFAYLGHHLGLGDAVRFLRGNGLSEGRARVLLDAQVGVGSSARRIAAMGDATTAHREWLVAYLDRNIRPAHFTRQTNV